MVRRLERIYFPLAPYAERLAKFWSQVEMNAHLGALCDRMLADGLPDIPVSQESDWGIPVPVAGFEKQRIYVWFEMAPGFLAVTQELLEARGGAPDWKRFWRSESAHVVQFFGLDNAYFYAVLVPPGSAVRRGWSSCRQVKPAGKRLARDRKSAILKDILTSVSKRIWCG